MSSVSSSPSPSPVAIRVELPKGDKWPTELNLTLSPQQNAVCEIKRAVTKATNVAAHLQRLQVVSNVDAFSFPTVVKVAFRTRSPQPSIPLKIETLNDRIALNLTIAADGDDTVLDLKFLISPHVNVAPENLRLYHIPTGSPSRVPLNDETLVKNAGLSNQSIIYLLFVTPSNLSGHGDAVRSSPQTIQFEQPDINNICVKFRKSVQKYANRPYLGARLPLKDGSSNVGGYSWQTYAQVGERVSRFGAGLRNLGLTANDTVGIMAPNRPEWTIIDLACSCQSFVSVPLYDTLGPDAVEYIVNHANVRAVVVTASMLKQITPIRKSCPTLELIVVMDDYLTLHEQKILSSANNQYTHLMSQVELLGKNNPLPDQAPKSDAMFTICYTSGTTGNPKGAILTHANMLSASNAIYVRIPHDMETDTEVMFSYLPLAHIYARVIENFAMGRGYAIGCFQGDTLKLVDDVTVLKPTIFPGVPRVWQRIHDRIKGQVDESNFIRRYLFNHAYSSKLEQYRRGDGSTSMWDSIVFSKIADKFGGRVKLVSTGAAPLSSQVAEFVRITLLSRFGEGYGLTETSGALTTTSYRDFTYGHVGTVVPCCEVKLVDVPDMDYRTADKPNPRGEVWARGYNIFSGYYREPNMTAEVLQDGWFMTGDIGMWQPDGSLRIIDRKKNIFKLSQGEYIRPEYIEGVYKQCKFVANSFVYGDSKQNYLVAVVVPNMENVVAWAQKNNLAQLASNPQELLKNPLVQQLIFKGMTDVAVQEKLRGFEHVKRIRIVLEDFSVDNGLLTPTFKLKRHAARSKYQQLIDEMYAQGEPTIPAKL